MLTQVIKHEWRNLSADKTLWFIVGLLSLLISYGLYSGLSWVHFQWRTVRAVHEHDEEKVARVRDHLAQLEQGRLHLPLFWTPANRALPVGLT